jgi:hypothetical protein
MKRKGFFLRRQIKKEGKKLFVYYGMTCLRPPKTTSFAENDWVSIVLSEGKNLVFNNIENYEIWK